MIVINIYGGPLKRDLVGMAYEEAGQSADYGIEPDEMRRAVGRMDAMLAEWRDGLGINLGYNFTSLGNGEDESGLPDAAVQVVALKLALRLNPTIGKTMSPESRAALAESWSLLRSAYTVLPTMGHGHITPVGGGNRWTSRTYLPVREDADSASGYPAP